MKIGNPADKPVAPPVAGTPCRGGRSGQDRQRGAWRGRAGRRRRRERQGRALEHGLDAAVGRRLGRIRCRQGGQGRRVDRQWHVQGQPRGDRRQADRQRTGTAQQGAELMPGAPRLPAPAPAVSPELEARLSGGRVASRRARPGPALARRRRHRPACLRAASRPGQRRQPFLRRRQERPAAAGAAHPARRGKRPGRGAARVAGPCHRRARSRHRRAAAARRRPALFGLRLGRPRRLQERRDPRLTAASRRRRPRRRAIDSLGASAQSDIACAATQVSAAVRSSTLVSVEAPPSNSTRQVSSASRDPDGLVEADAEARRAPSLMVCRM